MTPDFSKFTARLRDHLASEGRVPRGPDFKKVWDSQSLSLPDDIQFNSLALELFGLQLVANAAYRKICEARGATPNSVGHWKQIPAVPASAFKELELTCLSPGQRTHVFHSSGTTEQRPSRHFHSAESLAIYENSLWPWFAQHLLSDSESEVLILTPPPAQVPHSSLVHMFEIVRGKLDAPESAFVGKLGDDNSWALNLEATVAALNPKPETHPSSVAVLRRVENPQLILGTAFSFVHLLDYLGEHDLRFTLSPGSRVMETGGYKGRSRSLPKTELHALITERLGVPSSHIVCEYGMSELSSQAYEIASPLPARNEWEEGQGEGLLNKKASSPRPSPPLGEERETAFCAKSRRFQFPSWVRAQIISPETGREVADGETGLLRIFDLANVFSVMAIQTEDLAIRRGEGFELIGRAELAEPRGCSLMAT